MTIESMVISFLKYYFILVAICGLFAFVAWLVMQLLLPKSEQPLSEYDKRVLRLSFDRGSKNCVGTLEIINNAILFKSIKDGEGTVIIPLTQIVRTRVTPAIYTISFWAIWRYYLWIYYKLDNEPTEKQITFMFQRNAGIYGEEIKSKINSALRGRGIVIDSDENEKIYPKAKKLTTTEIIEILVYIFAIPVVVYLGKYIFGGLCLGTHTLTMGTIIGVIYLCTAYWVTRTIARLIIWAIRTLRER